MNESQEMEIIELLEDIISETSGIQILVNHKEDKLQRMKQTYLHLKGIESDEKIFSNEQLELLKNNDRARAIINEIADFLTKRTSLYRKFYNRVYTCKDKYVQFDFKEEMASFEQFYDYVNTLNREHFESMMSLKNPNFEQYLAEIEKHIGELNKRYIPFIEKKISSFQERVETEVSRGYRYEDSQVKDLIKEDPNINSRKKSISAIEKKYEDFLEGTDNDISTIQKKEKNPRNKLAYKLQYLTDKTKVLEKIQEYAGEIEYVGQVQKGGPMLVQFARAVTGAKVTKESPFSKKRNSERVKAAIADIDKIIDEHKLNVKKQKSTFKEEEKKIKKANKSSRKMLPAGNTEIKEEDMSENSKDSQHNEYINQLQQDAKQGLDESQIVRKFITDAIKIPAEYTKNPVAYDALSKYITDYIKHNFFGQDVSQEKFSEYANGLRLYTNKSDLSKGFKLEFSKIENSNLGKRIIIRRDSDNNIIIANSEERQELNPFSSSFSLEGTGRNDAYVYKRKEEIRQYDSKTNIELTRIVKTNELNDELQVMSERKDVYARDSQNPELVYLNDSKNPIDISILDDADIATLDGAKYDESSTLSASIREQTIKSAIDSRYDEAMRKYQFERISNPNAIVPQRETIRQKFEEEIRREYKLRDMKERIKASKYRDGFYTYPQYASLRDEIEGQKQK